MSWEQREELMLILHWTKEPVKRPFDYFYKMAVRSFLDGIDPVDKLVSIGVEPFVARRARDKAMIFLNNERFKRRRRVKEILAHRASKTKQFTHENIRVNIDPEQHRDYGMSNVSIYCVVEVYFEDELDREYLVNFSNFKVKEWLTKLMVWALLNKREVLVKPASEVEMANMAMFTPKDKEVA